MGYRPLILSVKCENWRMNDMNSDDADAEFSIVRKQALERDKHTCQFCGFKNLRYQEVHHSNDNHADNRKENLVTACTFCHLVQHIGFAGLKEEAILIYAPEIPQDILHHLVRTSMVCQRVYMTENSRKEEHMDFRKAADAAVNFMNALKERASAAQDKIGTSDPHELANVLMMLPENHYVRRAAKLEGIRLLPLGKRIVNNEDIMIKQVDSWISPGGPYSSLKPNVWSTLYKQYF